MSKMEEVEVHVQTFEMMNNLRMLMLYSYCDDLEESVFLESSLVSLPDTLRILYWTGFYQKSLPPKFCPQNLVRLEMPSCHLEQLWEGDQVFQVIYVPLCSRLTSIFLYYTSTYISQIIFSHHMLHISLKLYSHTTIKAVFTFCGSIYQS